MIVRPMIDSDSDKDMDSEDEFADEYFLNPRYLSLSNFILFYNLN